MEGPLSFFAGLRATVYRNSVWNSWPPPEREFFLDNLLVQLHFIIEMIRWTGLAPPPEI